MKLTGVELSLAVKDGIIDLDLKVPGVKAVVTIDSVAYSAWTGTSDAPGSPEAGRAKGGLSRSQWAGILMSLAHGLAGADQASQASDEDDDGEPPVQ